MKKFLKNIILFLILAVIVGEVIVRVLHTEPDIPQRTIDEYGIQKYFPNQEGYWKGGDHKWRVNKLGWVGNLPDDYSNLITIIGDSYIENFMNPEECHQAVFLKKKMNDNNFLEAARAGVSFIEALEISKQLDTLNPVKTLIYLNNNDFYESVYDINPLNDITQVNLKDKKINFGHLKAPGLKKILYNWKLLYYFYNRFPINLNFGNEEQDQPEEVLIEDDIDATNKVFDLIDYIKNNYPIDDKVLVFHPNSNVTFIKKCREVGFNVIVLDSSKDKTWSFEYDSHWTCYGHERAALQVYNALSQYIK